MLSEPLIGREHFLWNDIRISFPFLCWHGHAQLSYLATPDLSPVIHDLTLDLTQRAVLGKYNLDAARYYTKELIC